MRPAFVARQSDILVAIEDDLSTERRMASHLDRDVPPVSVPDVE